MLINKVVFNNKLKNNLPTALSILVLISSSTLTFVELNASRTQLMNDSIQANYDFANELDSKINQQINLIQNVLVKQWNSTLNASLLYDYNRFLNIIPGFFEFSKSFLALNWINSSGVIKFVYPYERNKAAINQSIVIFKFGNNRTNEGFAYARDNLKTGFTGLINFIQGSRGFAAYIPIVYRGNLTGFFNVLIDLNILLEDILNVETSSLNFYAFKIFDNGTLIANTSEDFDIDDTFVYTGKISFFNKEWVIHSRPLREYVQKASVLSIFPILIAIIILSAITYFLTNRLKQANRLLEKEFIEKEKYLEKMYNNRKLEALGTLSGGIAHDFNNIITNLMGHTQLINEIYIPQIDNIPVELKSLINESLDSIITNLNRSKDLTGQILSFSRQKSMNLIQIKLSALMMETMNMAKETSDRRIKFIYSIEDECFIFGNKTRVFQIFLNIILNSVDAVNPSSGEIIIKQKLIDNSNIINIDQLKEEYTEIEFNSKICMIVIEDNGKGLSEEQIDKVFDPFYTTKPLGLGTGLGLGIVYKNIKDLGGNIKINSIKEKGTKVIIYLPSIQPIIKIDHEKIINTEYRINMDILIVDDELDILETFGKLLKGIGGNIILKNNSKHAWEYYKDNYDSIDLVILDINMPEILGTELIKMIREINEDQNIIVISGYSEYDIPVNIDFLQKPFEFDELVKLILSLNIQ